MGASRPKAVFPWDYGWVTASVLSVGRPRHGPQTWKWDLALRALFSFRRLGGLVFVAALLSAVGVVVALSHRSAVPVASAHRLSGGG